MNAGDISDIRVCILRIEGTNCEEESLRAFRRLGASAEHVHLKQLLGTDVKDSERRRLGDYQVLMIPGGFSSGDYVRAGAIWAARMKSKLREDLIEFVESGKPVLGICNGFQVLVELGLLPGFGGTMSEVPQAVLGTNDSAKFECRPTLLKHENKGKCIFTSKLEKGKVVMLPSAHAEGKLLFPLSEQEALVQRLIDNDQIVFRYVDDKGDYAGYPWNPNGSYYNIAGICNPAGNVFGMMPHPERVFFKYTHPDWTREGENSGNGGEESKSDVGDGRVIFESVLEYVMSKF